MKRIKKGPQPEALIQWRARNAAIPDAKYGTHGFPTAQVQESLLIEQGWICAYTMIRVNVDSSHIEHLKPQTISRNEGLTSETASYENMVTCYPRRNVPGKPAVAFGAIHRGSAWDASRFISPLTPTCETAYRFRLDGTIEPASSSNLKAKWMIETLALDAGELEEMRRKAIEAIGLSLTSDDPVSAKEASRLLADVCKLGADGRHRPFCVAIQHAAKEYIGILAKNAKRTKHIRAAKKVRRK